MSTYLAGLGLGLLSTAAVSLCSTLADLPVTGAEVVRVSFRLGTLVDEISQNLEPRDTSGSPDTWASVVPGAKVEEVQAELDAIHAREVRFSGPKTALGLMANIGSLKEHSAAQQDFYQRMG